MTPRLASESVAARLFLPDAEKRTTATNVVLPAGCPSGGREAQAAVRSVAGSRETSRAGLGVGGGDGHEVSYPASQAARNCKRWAWARCSVSTPTLTYVHAQLGSFRICDACPGWWLWSGRQSRKSWRVPYFKSLLALPGMLRAYAWYIFRNPRLSTDQTNEKDALWYCVLLERCALLSWE